MANSINPQDVVDYRAPRDAQLSPDGCSIAFTVRAASKNETPELPGEIWVADVASGQSRQFTFGATTEQLPRWSPDSQCLAFLSDRVKPGQRQLYVMDIA
jgi:Tol biopolymer transport system component